MTAAKPQGHLHFLLVFLFISINLRMSFSAANPLIVALMIPSSLLYHYTEEKLGGRRKSIIFYLVLSSIANAALLLGPLYCWHLFAGLLGIGLGALFTLGMSLIVSNSADSRTTIALSGLAQGMSFTLGGVLAWACSLVMTLPHHHL